MTYEEADNEAREIIAAIQVDGERWHYTAWGRGPRAYAIPEDERPAPGHFFGVVTLISPVHPKDGTRGNWIVTIANDDLRKMTSISAKLNEGVAIIRKQMCTAREENAPKLSGSSNP